MKACPFCGYDEAWVWESGEGEYKAVCKVCGGSGPPAKTHEMARRKWDGILNNASSEEKFEEILQEDMGGVTAPAATLVNTPGMGNAQPASQTAMTGAQQYDSGSIGSGDKWGSDNNTKRKKPKAKTKTKTQHKLTSLEDYAAKFPLGKSAK